MKRVKQFLALSLSVCMMSAALLGCSNTNKKDDSTDSTKATTESNDTAGDSSAETTGGAADGDTLDVAVNVGSEPESIDPHLNTTSDGGMMLEHMFEGLMKRVDNGEGMAEITYGQAESYEVNEDQTVYTFKLRDGIKWSDGQDVVAGDFVYSWQRLVDPETASQYNYMLDMVKNAKAIMNGEMETSELGVVAIDEKTLEVTLENATPYFDQICAFAATYPVRQDIVEEHGTQWIQNPETYISNGPYKMVEWVHTSNIKMEKNENYYDLDRIGPDTIDFILMDDANAMLTSFNSGELDFIKDMPVDEVPSLIESGDIKLLDSLGTYYLCFQNEVEPFDNPLVRQAFSLAIDRDHLVNTVLRAGQSPATAFVPSGIFDEKGLEGDDFRTVGGDYIDTTAVEANEEKARELLAEAGYPDGEGFPTIEYIYNTNDNHRVIGEAVQGMLKDVLNVDITLSNQDWNVFTQERKDGNFTFARHGWFADYNDPISFLDLMVTGGGNNNGRYSNPEYDALIEEAKATVDVAKRMELLHQAEDLLMEEAGVLPVYFYRDKYMLNDELQGLFYSSEGHYYFSEITKK